MTSALKPIKLHGEYGPNPPKVAMVLSILQIPYEYTDTTYSNVKSPTFLKITPNGRMPAMYDANTDMTLWESGAIIEYLVETYDHEHKIRFPAGSKESFLAKQWLQFQVSGQGPYYGQAFWFTKRHSEKVQSAIDRYFEEIKRVTGVLEMHLKRQKEANVGTGEGPWLVGNKFSYADLAFVPWQTIALEFSDMEPGEFPEVDDWMKRLGEQEGIKKVMEHGLFPKI